MSYPVFPSIVPGSWSYGFPIRKSPYYSTIVQTPVSGRGEVRLPMMPYCRWQFGFDVDYLFGAVNDPSVQPWLYNVLGFWMQQQGQAAAWLYSDPFDNSVTNSQFGTGDGVTTSFQLTRSVGSAEDIIQNVNGTPSIYVAGTAESPTVSSTGMVTFAAAPAKGAALTWSGSFYFLCRFIDDKMALQMDMANYWSLSNMRFTSLIL